MAYASKYYDPQKAHEYYMKNRELKGYEDRYGGSRGDGTSAASSGSLSKTQTATSTQKHNQSIKIEIQSLRDKLSAMSTEERKRNREKIQDQIQALREKTKGGSTSGFNQKGMEAASYIKDQMEKERNSIISKANKDADKEMLSKVQHLADDIKNTRASGQSVDNSRFMSRVKALLNETKKKKIKSKRQYTSDYKQKYKDEIDKLRSDKTMYSYYDRKNSNRSKLNDSIYVSAEEEKDTKAKSKKSTYKRTKSNTSARNSVSGGFKKIG
jgi:vacuolar-type H+-ATPase subunit E/Vma4